ncbi:16S rRNA (cytosine(1402)-N(4))-methyltransferase RsmH [Dasania marina]|uniref:16S rRNA (cytosine(1402)-N(4))-methyltransferase RsmH n=1 Tax=Dasania marina TaxID=471499 RepID=UPI0030D84EE1|tara:strand:+ start:20289 stop:21218 length:930 start_codon:yes stop_codon:yes gene_type:complete
MHETVLLHEAVDALLGDDDQRLHGSYADGTFGRGGHSAEILKRLSEHGRLIATDKDPQAIATGKEFEQQDSRFAIVQGSFADLKNFIADKNIASLDGILLDLGVSSPQLDQAERGFSFMRDGYLDMRMNPDAGQSAAEWIAEAKVPEIRKVLKEFGDERYALRIAEAIVAERDKNPITTTLHLQKVVAEAHPAWERGKNPATKAFQGIRIFINNELGDLEDLLNQALDLLSIGGRLVVISFHSLEDRMVKRFIKQQVRGDVLPAGVPILDSQLNKRMKQIGKAVRAGSAEVEGNVRSRSAIMRVAEKIA